MRVRNGVLLALTIAFAACGPGEENSGTDGNMKNTEEECADGRFDETTPFTYFDYPFEFEYPAGWTVTGTEGSDVFTADMSRLTSTGAAGYVSIQTVVPKSATERESANSRYELVGMIVHRTIEFGGEMVDIYTYSPDDPNFADVVQVKFVVPFEQQYREASIIFRGSDDDCLEERTALREMFIDSLAPPM